MDLLGIRKKLVLEIFFLLFISLFLVCLFGCKKKQPEAAQEFSQTKPDKANKKETAKEKKGEFSIGVLYWSMNISGQVAMREGLEERAEVLNKNRGDNPKINLIKYVAGDGVEGMNKQIRQMYELIEKKVDLIIVQPTDIAALSKALQAANDAGIPVVAYDQYIIGGKLVSYVTSNNYQAGYLDGEYIASKFNKEKEIKIVLVEYPHVSSTVQRVDGFMDALREAGQKYKIISSYNAVEPESGKIAGKQILKDFPKKGSIDVVFTVNDGGGFPVVKALTEAGRTEIMVASIDGAPKSVDILRDGGIIVIDSAQFCGVMGAEAINVANLFLLGKNVPTQILIPVFPITSETVGQYKGWMGPIPKRFKKSWESKDPFWEGSAKIIKPVINKNRS